MWKRKTLLVFLAGAILFTSYFFMKELVLQEDKIDSARYDAMTNRISEVLTPVDIIETDIGALHRPTRAYVNCVRGNGRFIIAASGQQIDIAFISNLFLEDNWILLGTSDNQQYLRLATTSGTAEVSIYPTEPDLQDNESDKTFTVGYIYGEPQIGNCYG